MEHYTLASDKCDCNNFLKYHFQLLLTPFLQSLPNQPRKLQTIPVVAIHHLKREAFTVCTWLACFLHLTVDCSLRQLQQVGTQHRLFFKN